MKLKNAMAIVPAVLCLMCPLAWYLYGLENLKK